MRNPALALAHAFLAACLASSGGRLEAAQFTRGDTNADGAADLSDSIFTLGCLFLGSDCPACEDAADANDDGVLDVSDPVAFLSFAFLGGAQPPQPFPACGEDPTGDELSCSEHLSCGDSRDTITLPHDEPPPAFELRWQGLKDPGAVVRIPLGGLGPVVAGIEVRNVSGAELGLLLAIEAIADGKRGALAAPRLVMAPGESRTVEVDLAQLDLDSRAMKAAGRLRAYFEAVDALGKPAGHGLSEAVYFHASGKELLLYGVGPYLERFGAGNLSGRPLPAVDRAVKDLKSELGRHGLRSLSPTLAGVTVPRVTLEAAGSPDLRLTFLMSADAFLDASIAASNHFGGVERDYGEDYGRDPGLNMARMMVWVNDSQGLLWHGFLDAFGRSPPIATVEPTVDIQVALWYQTPDASRSMFVTSTDIDGNIPVYNLEGVPADGFRIVWMDPTQPEQTIYAAASSCLERFHGGVSGTFEFEWTGESGTTGTNYHEALGGIPRVQVRHNGWQSKFVMAHEWGHAILLPHLEPELTEDDLDYGSTGWHSFQSKEWQFTAAFEGFADYVATAVWNDEDLGEDGYYVQVTSEIPLHNRVTNMGELGRYYETEICGNNCQANHGVELDWAQLFWHWRTTRWNTPSGSFRPTHAQLVEHWLAAYPWAKHEGFYEKFVQAAQSVYGAPGEFVFALAGEAAGVAH